MTLSKLISAVLAILVSIVFILTVDSCSKEEIKYNNNISSMRPERFTVADLPPGYEILCSEDGYYTFRKLDGRVCLDAFNNIHDLVIDAKIWYRIEMSQSDMHSWESCKADSVGIRDLGESHHILN